MTMKNCNHCGKDYLPKKFDFNSKHCSKKCSDAAKWKRYYDLHPEFHKERRHVGKKRNEELVDSFKTECLRCKIKDKRVLDFHHEGNKKISVGQLRKAGYSIETILKEINKCILLCANCHRIHHWEERHGILRQGSKPNRKGGIS